MSQFHILGLTFYPYGFILGLAILAGLRASSWLAKRRKIPVQLIEGLFWWVVIGGIIGARVYHVIDKWQEIYSLNPQNILYIWNGGLGIWGAVVGGTIGLLLFLQKTQELKTSAKGGQTRTQYFLNLLDVVMFGVPLGQAIGRWGNFFNNEIVGKNGEPLFLYESVLDLILFGGLVGLVRSRRFGKSGKISGVYLIGYGVIRFLLEPLRPEAIMWKIGTMPVAGLFSIIAVGFGMLLICRRRS